jgi:hypothetical protein
MLSNLFPPEKNDVGINELFINEWIVKTVTKDSLSECMSYCTTMSVCSSGQFSFDTNECKILKKAPNEEDIVFKPTTMTFYRGKKNKYTFIY